MNERMRKLALRVLPAIAGIAVICMLFRGIDWHAVAAVVQGIGSGFAIIASIYLFGCLFDTLGWRELLQTDRRIGFWRLLGVHIAGEAYYRFIPAGVVVGEGVKSILARKQFGIKYSHVVSSLLLRKLFMGIAQMLYVGGAVAIGLLTFSDGPAGLLVTAGGLLVLGLLLLFGIIGYGMWKGKLTTSLFSQLSKLPSHRLRQTLQEHSQSFIETDALLVQALRRRKWNVLRSVLYFSFNWLTELLETVLILGFLIVSLSAAQVMLFEPVISLVRSIAFMFPGGLGVMDTGYVSALRSFGVNDAAVLGAAFIVVKRAKEIVWILIGIALTLVLGGTENNPIHINLAGEAA